MSMLKPNNSRVNVITGTMTIVVGFFVIGGWIFDIPLLTSIFEGYVSMKLNTAILFVLSGLALVSLSHESQTRKVRVVLCILVLSIATLTIFEYVFRLDLGIDELLLHDNYPTPSKPGRMSMASALNFVLISGSLLTIKNKKFHSAIQVSLLVTFSLSILAIIVNDFTIRYYDILPLVTTMALHTAGLFLILTFGIFYSPMIQPTKFNLEVRLAGGFMAIVTVVIITFYIFTKNNNKEVESSNWIDRTSQSLSAAEQLITAVHDVALTSRNFIDTGDKMFLVKNEGLAERIDRHLKTLREINFNDRERNSKIDSLENVINVVINQNKKQIELYHSTRSSHANDSTNALINEQLMQKIIAINHRIQSSDRKQLQDRRTISRTEYIKTSRTIIIFQVVIILVLLAVFLIVRSNTNARNLAEQDLQNSRERFSTTLSSIGDAIIATDNNSAITFMNQVAQEITGWNEHMVKGYPLEKVFYIINEQTRETVENPVEKVLKLRHHVALASNSLLVRKDKSEIAIEESASPIMDSDRNITGVVLVFRDVTARKLNEEALRESEEKFEKAFQSSGGGISITRMSDTTFLDVNQRFTEMTGYSKEELIGNSSIQLGIVTDIKLRDKILEEIKTTGAARHFEMKVQQKSGEKLDVLCSVETIVLKNERYGLNIIYDITERKKVEAALESANKELEAFSYSISHDLRAPLRSIRGFSAILEEDFGPHLDDEGRRVLATISRNAAKMNTLIDDLLEFSRVGRSGLIRSEIDTQKLVNKILDELNTTAEYRAKVKQKELLPMYADVTLMTQVWINLISNAIKYSVKVERPEIEIGSRHEGQNLLYYVKDNGAGFDMLYVDKLFGVFQRLHRSQDFEGTGIGLSIVKRIIVLHGGKVWAEGAIGKGATFYFQIPNGRVNE